MIKIKNIYYMLSYAYSVLQEDGYKSILTEEFDHVADLFAAHFRYRDFNSDKKGFGARLYRKE